MDKGKIIEALNAKMADALVAAAAKVNAQSTKFTPVYRGDLRRDKLIRTKSESGNVVIEIVQSPEGSRSHEYAPRQYFEAQRHAGAPNALEPLPDRELSKNNRRGGGDKVLYSRRYRAALKYGAIKKMPAPEWFSKVINTPSELSQVLDVFRNRFKSRSVSVNGR